MQELYTKPPQEQSPGDRTRRGADSAPCAQASKGCEAGASQQPSNQRRPKYNNTSIDKPRGAAPPRAANNSPRRRESRAHRAAEKAACSASFCARHLSNALFVSARQARNASNSAPLFALREAMRPSPQDLCGNQISDAPRHRPGVVPVTASSRWRGDSMPSTRRRPRNCICSMARRFYAIDVTMSP